MTTRMGLRGLPALPLLWLLLGGGAGQAQVPPFAGPWPLSVPRPEPGLPQLTLSLAGPAVTVFRHAPQGCDPLDIPDAPARAIRTGSDAVQLYAPHFIDRRLGGAALIAALPTRYEQTRGTHAG